MAFEAYLYVEGIQGSSTSENAPKTISLVPGAGPIEINSFSLGIEMPMVENRSATGAVTVGRANFEDFETSKSLDIATCSLLFFCLSGKQIPKALVRIYRASGKNNTSKPDLYMEIHYDDIIITEVGVSGSGDELPSETLKFNYGKVVYRYHRTAKSEGSGGPLEFNWNRVTNTGSKAG